MISSENRVDDDEEEEKKLQNRITEVENLSLPGRVSDYGRERKKALLQEIT